MTDRTPALEWAKDLASPFYRTDSWTAVCGDFQLHVHRDACGGGKSWYGWRVTVIGIRSEQDDLGGYWGESETRGQLAAEDWLRAQRDALGVLDRKEES